MNKYGSIITIISQESRSIANLTLQHTQDAVPKNDNTALSLSKHSQNYITPGNNIILNKTPERIQDQVIINNNSISPMIKDRMDMLKKNTRNNHRKLRSNKVDKNNLNT